MKSSNTATILPYQSGIILLVYLTAYVASEPYLLWTAVDPTPSSKLLLVRGNGQKIYTDALADTIMGEVVQSKSKSVMVGMACDYTDDLIFWTDPQRKIIYKKSFTTDVVESVYEQISIGVEDSCPCYRYSHLYWCDLGNVGKIEKSNLNGEERETIVSESDNGNLIAKPNGLTIDYVENRLYWVDISLKKVMSVDLGGNFYAVREVYEEQNFRYPFDITLDEGFFFVSDYSTGSVWLIDRSNTDNNIALSIGDLKPLGITVYSEWRQQTSSQGNCLINNGGCEHLCVGDPNGHKCLCRHGYVLDSDQSSCSTGIAVDWLANNIYWTDYDGKAIYVSKLNGWHKTRLISENIDQPQGIAVHPDRKLYWVDINNDKIESSNFDGEDRILVSHTTQNALGISIFQDHIYWTDQQQVHDFDHKASKEVGVTTIDGSPRVVLAFDKSRQVLSFGPCDIDNGDCDEICIPSSAGAECVCSQPRRSTCTPVVRCPMEFFSGSMTASCVNIPGFECYFRCDDGFIATTASGLHCQDDGTWDTDTNTLCKLDIRLEYFLLVGDTQSDEGKIFYINILSPTLEYTPLPLASIKNPVALDFDYVGGKVYWTDVDLKTINRASLNGSNFETIINVDIDVPDGLAIDVKNGMIYWTDTGLDRIQAAKLDGSNRVNITTTDLDGPRAIIVDSDASLLYWSDVGTSPKIEQANLDGSERQVLVSSNLGWANGLALDRTDRKLFWCDGKNGVIEYYDLNEGSRHLLITLSEREAHPFGLALVGNYLYWTQWHNNRLQRADKYTGSNVISVGHPIFERPNDIHIFTKQLTGGAAGAGFLLLILAVLVVCTLRCRKKTRRKREQEPIYCDIDELNNSLKPSHKLGSCHVDSNKMQQEVQKKSPHGEYADDHHYIYPSMPSTDNGPTPSVEAQQVVNGPRGSHYTAPYQVAPNLYLELKPIPAKPRQQGPYYQNQHYRP
ncbi:low-density lipoprotein receptor-related protein 4-like [Glandiceps talaboti]